MSLYLWIDLLSISVPLLVSFHPKIQLHKQWSSLFPAILMAMIPYIVWDVYFTRMGYWGFNSDYLMGLEILSLPIEEWLFFICIPYACVFTHLVILKINPRLELSGLSTKRISISVFILLALIGVLNYSRAYTSVDVLFALAILAWTYFSDFELLRSYLITFLFMLVPFFIVNGILTGLGIENQVVWYNDQENLGIRIFTIPVEDVVYAFSLILLNLVLFRRLRGMK
jgi:lycopene cyclase domain-containing protein